VQSHLSLYFERSTEIFDSSKIAGHTPDLGPS